MKLIPPLILAGISGCVARKMSVQEAREVAVSMNRNSFTPPPRRIGDILSVMDQAVSPNSDALADFADPKPVGFADLQHLLRPEEALVVITTTETKTFTWGPEPAKMRLNPWTCPTGVSSPLPPTHWCPAIWTDWTSRPWPCRRLR